MAHTPGFPTHGRAKVERVRNDGQWLRGDRANMDLIPCQTGDHKWVAPPRLILERWTDAAPPPVVDGWKFHRFSGMGSGRIPTPGNPTYITWLEYTPIECTDPTAPPEQLALF